MSERDRDPSDAGDGVLNTHDLARHFEQALSAGATGSPEGPGATRTASSNLLLGRLALEAGLITAEQLKEALAHLASAEGRGEFILLGQYLLGRNWLSAPALSGLLSEQEKRAQAFPQLPRYEFRSLVGQGATALVYSAWDRELKRPVALKLLRETTAMSETARARFRREAQVAAGLSHPNVVAVYDAGEVKGQLFLVMELVEGRPFAEILHDPAVTRRAKLALLESAGRGVAAAHAHGIVHRDLKPANILVMADGVPKVGDFGLAHLVDSSTELTKSGATLGTPLYMSPEQVGGHTGALSPATDVYALGAILYELVAGRPPHKGDTTMELYQKIVHEEPVAPSKLAPDVPADLETIILKSIDKDPRRRYPTAEALAADLKRHLAGEPIEGKRLPWGARLLRRARRHRGALIGLIALVALALAAIVAISSAARRRHRIDSEMKEALRFESEKRYVEALTLLRTALEEDPGNEVARSTAARIALRETAEEQLRKSKDQRRRQAERILESIRPALGEAAHDLYNPKATDRSLGDRLQAVRTRIQEAIALEPSLPLGHYLLAHAFEIEEEEEPALASAREALEIDPDYAPAHYVIGRLDLDRALKRMVGATPDEREVRQTEAKDLVDRATRELGKAVVREADLEDNLHRALARTILAYLEGPPDRALDLARKGFDRFSSKEGREEFLRIEGLASTGLDQIRAFDQALEIRPNWTTLRLARAGAELAAGDPDSALRDCEAILRLHPGDPDAALNHAVALSLTGNLEGALAELDGVISRRPSDAVALYNRALCRSRKGDPEGALQDLAQTLRLRPDFAAALNNRGSLRLQRNELSQAIEDFDLALRQKPVFPKALNNRASALFRKGDPRGALRDLDEALRLEPGFAEAYFNRSLVRLKREEPSEALEDLAQAIQLRPSWTAPYVMRAQVRAKRGDRKGAREDARRALDLGAGTQDRRELDALHLDDE